MLKGEHHYARYLVACEWLREKGYDPERLLSPVDLSPAWRMAICWMACLR